METKIKNRRWQLWAIFVSVFLLFAGVYAQESGKKMPSYSPVAMTEDFGTIMARMKAAKPDVMKRHLALLNERYDLSNRPTQGITMSRGKPVQEGVRAKISPNLSGGHPISTATR